MTDSGALTVSVELAPYQLHPTDNAMKTDAEIRRFFMGDESTIGLYALINGTNVHTLAEFCEVAGPQLWRLCCYMHRDFARMFHLGKYVGSPRDSLSTIVKARVALRKVFTDFYRLWAQQIDSGKELVCLSYQNQKGQLMNPLHPRGAPAFRCYSPHVPDEFIEQWFADGRLSRDGGFGYPCSIVSRSVVIDSWLELEVTENGEYETIRVNHYGTQIELLYEYAYSKRHHILRVTPDSFEENSNFITTGCHISHPLVQRHCPNILAILMTRE